VEIGLLAQFEYMDNPKVLVVDDDATTCNLLETVLQMEDFSTSSINKVENDDIIAVLKKEKPGILILDYHLGSIETLEFITTIRANSDWQNLPILMTSAIDRHQECLKAGANKFMLKPFDWQEVTNQVNELRDELK
jgi:DNA-binding response OmpR family regulator